MGFLSTVVRGLEGRASPEDPSIPLSFPTGELWEALGGGGKSRTGLRVTPRSAMTYGAVYRAVSMIAQDVAKVPLLVYRRGEGEARDRDARHPAYRLLHSAPNEWHTPYEFRTLLQVWALLRGNGYAWIERNGRGDPMALLPLDPSTVTPERRNGVLVYWVQVDGERIGIHPVDMLHIRGPSMDGLSGLSIVSLARESFGLGLGMLAYSAVFFRNSAAPQVVLESDAKIKDKDQARRDWEKIYGGIDRSHRAAIVDQGLKVKPLSISAKDSQFIEGREHQIRDVATWFGIPPHRLGDTTRTSYKSLEAEDKAYLDGALDPWLVAWEQQCGMKLLSLEQKRAGTHFVEAIRLALIRIDASTRAAFYGSLVERGIMLRNEVRQRENLPPLPGGDRAMIPGNLVLLDEDGNPPEPAEEEPTPQEDPPQDPPADPDDDDQEDDEEEGRGAPEPPPAEPPAEPPLAPPAVQIDPEACRRAAAAVVTEAAARVATRLQKWREKLDKKGEDAGIDHAERCHGGIVRQALAPALDMAAAAGGEALEVDQVARGLLEEVVGPITYLEDWAEALPGALLRRLGLDERQEDDGS